MCNPGLRAAGTAVCNPGSGTALPPPSSDRIVRGMADRILLVGEAAIWNPMSLLFDQHRLAAEAATAVGVAALLEGKMDPSASPVVVVVSGVDVGPSQVAAALLDGERAPTL